MYPSNSQRIEQQLKNLKHKVTCGVQFFDTFEDFPATGKECAVYVDKSTGAFFIWNGTAYVTCCGEGSTIVAQGIQGIQGLRGLQGLQGLSGSYGLANGAFFSTLSQSISTLGSVVPMTFNSEIESNGVYLDNVASPNLNSFYLTNPGIYNIQFSAQLLREFGGSDAHIGIFLKRNGVTEPYTGTYLHFNSNNTYLVAAWNFFVTAQAGDYFQLMWTVDDLDIQLVYLGEDSILAGVPETPSVILTVNQIM
jgi:hypothetical protein